MKNNKYICVFDFETDGKDPKTCNPVQFAAVILDPRTLEIEDEFQSMMRPPDIWDDKDYYKKHKDTVDWHAKQKGKKPKEILEEWKAASEAKIVWKSFQEFNFKYHTKHTGQSSYTAPIPAGYNIINFDIPIAQRLAEEYKCVDSNGNSRLFSRVNKFDVYDMVFSWFENLTEPDALSADVVFEFLGIDVTGAHDAMVDVKNTAKVLRRFLQFQRRMAPSPAKFKGAFKEKKK